MNAPPGRNGAPPRMLNPKVPPSKGAASPESKAWAKANPKTIFKQIPNAE